MANTTPILDAHVTFIPGFLAPEIADITLAALLAELPWKRRISRMYGKMYPFLAWKCGLRITPTRIRTERTSPNTGNDFAVSGVQSAGPPDRHR
jgi:hypothetical protein